MTLPKEDDGCHTSFANLCSCMVEDGNQTRAAVPVVASNLELRQEVCSELWLHTARKWLEIKL